MRPLSDRQLQYAALDAAVQLHLFDAMASRQALPADALAALYQDWRSGGGGGKGGERNSPTNGTAAPAASGVAQAAAAQCHRSHAGLAARVMPAPPNGLGGHCRQSHGAPGFSSVPVYRRGLRTLARATVLPATRLASPRGFGLRSSSLSASRRPVLACGTPSASEAFCRWSAAARWAAPTLLQSRRAPPALLRAGSASLRRARIGLL